MTDEPDAIPPEPGRCRMFGGRAPVSHILRLALLDCAGAAERSRFHVRMLCRMQSTALRRTPRAQALSFQHHQALLRHPVARLLSAVSTAIRDLGRGAIQPRIGRSGCGLTTWTACRWADRRRSCRSRGVGCPEDRSGAIQPDHRTSASRTFVERTRAGLRQRPAQSPPSILSAYRRPARHRRSPGAEKYHRAGHGGM